MSQADRLTVVLSGEGGPSGAIDLEVEWRLVALVNDDLNLGFVDVRWCLIVEVGCSDGMLSDAVE